MKTAIVKENDSLVSVHFDSILDFMDHIETGTNKREFIEYGERVLVGSSLRERWFGPNCISSKEVFKSALLGDDDLLKSLESKISTLEKDSATCKTTSQIVKKVKRKNVWSNAGDEIDIHKVYAGNYQNAWRKKEAIKIETKIQLVTLFIDIAGLSDASAVSSLWRAAVAVKLYRELLAAGKSVKIIVGGASEFAFENCTKDMTVGVVVKDYNQPLTDSRLAAMANLGFYRTWGFVAKTCQQHKLAYGLGYSIPATDKTVPINLQEEIEKGHTKFVYLRKCDNSYSASESLKFAYKQMENEK